MEKSTKTALVVATSGLVVNQYLKHKQVNSDKGYLENSEQNLKMLGGGVAILGYSSAAILELTKNSPKARKVAFIGLAAGTVGFFALVISALKKFN